MVKSIDTSILGAFHILSKSSNGGVNTNELACNDLMGGVLDLVEKGYAEKIRNGGEFLYCLTQEGKKYLFGLFSHVGETF
ncbi:MAG: hypothetical protein ABIH28_03795 [archaeon]